MPCTEFVNAIAWNKQSTTHDYYPFHAYFTRHLGLAPTSQPGFKDAVHYASGDVSAVDTPTPHLMGTLNGAKNSDQPGQMVETSSLTYDVEIFPDGTLSYLMKINGQSVGGVPPTVVQATCVNNVLLTATTGSEVVAVGVARKPQKGIVT
jgi:hypothetical protein